MNNDKFNVLIYLSKLVYGIREICIEDVKVSDG